MRCSCCNREIGEEKYTVVVVRKPSGETVELHLCQLCGVLLRYENPKLWGGVV